MATIKAGTYRFNDVLTLPDNDLDVTFSTPFSYVETYTASEVEAINLELAAQGYPYSIAVQDYKITTFFSRMTIIPLEGGNLSLSYLGSDSEIKPSYFTVSPSDPVVEAMWLYFNNWEGFYWGDADNNFPLLTLTFDDDSTPSNPAFEPWFTANTKQLVTIEYNGSVIASLTEGKATLPCKDKVMHTDIVVNVPELGGESVPEWDGSYTIEV